MDDTSSKKKSGITVFDQFWRKHTVHRAQWFHEIINPQLQKVWNDPAALATVLTEALDQGFDEELIPSSLRLLEIDHSLTRRIYIRASILILSGKLDAAEFLLREATRNSLSDPKLTAILAKTLYLQNHSSQEVGQLSLKTLQLDPNNQEALHLLAHCTNKAQHKTILETLARVPHAVNAQIQLGAILLSHHDNEKGLELLKNAAAQSKSSEERLAQIATILNTNSLHLETLQILDPLFHKSKHGIDLGAPLTEALLELGQTEKAQQLIEVLQKKRGPLCIEKLNNLETALAHAYHAASQKINTEEIQLEEVLVDGPIWIHKDSNARELFPLQYKHATHFTVLLASLSPREIIPNMGKKEPSTAGGRLSRVIPLLFAEWLDMGTDASAQAIIPWIKNHGAFPIFPRPWTLEEASQWTNPSREPSSLNFIVTINLIETEQGWKLNLRIFEELTSATRINILIPFPLDSVAYHLKNLQKVLYQCVTKLGVKTIPTPKEYNPPTEPQAYLQYAALLEHALACRCAAQYTELTADGPSLTGERSILRMILLACLENPDSLPLRLLLSKTLGYVKKINPNACKELKNQVTWLEKTFALSGPSQAVLHSKFKRLFKH